MHVGFQAGPRAEQGCVRACRRKAKREQAGAEQALHWVVRWTWMLDFVAIWLIGPRGQAWLLGPHEMGLENYGPWAHQGK